MYKYVSTVLLDGETCIMIREWLGRQCWCLHMYDIIDLRDIRIFFYFNR